MILIRFTGGLGNQMFQYALGTRLALKNNTVLKADLSLLNDRSRPHELVTHRDFDLDIFNLEPNLANKAEIERFNGHTYNHLAGKIWNKLLWLLFRKQRLIVEQGRNFHASVCLAPDDRCLVGAWQSEKYFKPIESEIRKTFTFREPLKGKALELSQEIMKNNSLCINVRRGDYVTSPMYNQILGAMPMEYFQKALELMCSKQNIDRIYIFSDDAEWARENIKPGQDTFYVGEEYNGPKYSSKLQLMASCKHFIIPNSTFSWWAAWLSDNPHKIVIAPRQWYKDRSIDDSDLVPQDWIRI